MSEPGFWQDSQDYQDYVIENSTLTENLANLKKLKKYVHNMEYTSVHSL